MPLPVIIRKTVVYQPFSAESKRRTATRRRRLTARVPVLTDLAPAAPVFPLPSREVAASSGG